jgi:hypothetical protein
MDKYEGGKNVPDKDVFGKEPNDSLEYNDTFDEKKAEKSIEKKVSKVKRKRKSGGSVSQNVYEVLKKERDDLEADNVGLRRDVVQIQSDYYDAKNELHINKKRNGARYATGLIFGMLTSSAIIMHNYTSSIMKSQIIQEEGLPSVQRSYVNWGSDHIGVETSDGGGIYVPLSEHLKSIEDVAEREIREARIKKAVNWYDKKE